MEGNEKLSCRLDALPLKNEVDIEWILRHCSSVAVVGLSPDLSRASNQVASVLKKNGYRIIPVNPNAQEVLGERCYSDLDAVSGRVDLVLIFRRSELVPAIVGQAVKKGALAVWMQEGIVNESAGILAREEGLKVVMDRCISKEIYKRRKI